MKSCILIYFIILSIVLDASASQEPTMSKSGIMAGFLNIFRGSSTRIDKTGTLHTRYLAMNMDVSPLPLKLSDARQLKVKLLLTNKSKKVVHLEFPTTQRIEILIRDEAGELVTQWSEDQSFSNNDGYALINPTERLEYFTSISTRDLKVGRKYFIQGFFPNFNELSVSKTIVPEP